MKAIAIRVNGQWLTDSEIAPLIEVRTLQKLSLPALCELVFLTGVGPNQPRAWEIGATLELRVSREGSVFTLFEGVVVALEHVYQAGQGPQIRVRAYDRLLSLRRRQFVGSHVQVTAKDIAQAFIRDAGLNMLIGDSSVNGFPLWERLIQDGQSNLEFLRQQCGSCGLFFTLRGNTLSFCTLKGLGDVVPLGWGKDLMEVSFESNALRSARKVKASGWDSRLVDAHHGAAYEARSGRTAKASALPEAVGGPDTWTLHGLRSESPAVIGTLAQAELDRRTAQELVLRGRCRGNGLLRPGTSVEVTGVAANLAGRYVVTESTHIIDPDNTYVTEITTEPPDASEGVRETLVTLGNVSRVNDPLKLGRIQVKLPCYGDAETDWMQVVAPGAGKEKGFVALPDVGDLVIVLCTGCDLAHGVVLGAVFGDSHPPLDAGVGDGRTRRYLMRTPGGHCVTMDDSEGRLRVEGSSGTFLEFSRDKVTLHATSDLEISAPGKSIVVGGAAIDFKRT